MADKRIQDLTPATSVQTTDRFVLEQSGQAKSLTGQILINDLATALDGHGGINSISYTAPTSPSLEGTLTITTADGTEFDFAVTNGRGISGITWETEGTAADGMVHIGTIEYDDGTTSTVQFQDGMQGIQGVQTYVWFVWSDVYPTADSDLQDNVGAYIGIYSGTSSTAPTHYTDYIWYQYKGDVGDPGSSIQSISKTATSGLVDTYTVTLTNGNTTNFTVTNAKSISSIAMTSGTHAAGTTDIYTITFNDGDTASFSVYNGANGLGSVSTVSGIQADGSGNVPQVISGNGAPTTATIGQMNQLYYDLSNSVLYYCAGESGGTYSWLGAGVTVDSSLSGSSTNPVQNKVITGRIGTGALPNSSSDLTAAINYVNGAIPTAATTTPLADTTSGAVGTGTKWAKNDHQHPLNVATSGVPEMDGTASLGSATTYAKTDHVHPTDTSRASAADLADVSASFASCISGKKVSIIGDSISTFDADGYKTAGYAQYYPNVDVPDVQSVEDTWWKQVLDASGCVIEKNASYSGSRATNTDNTRPSFYARCTTTLLGNPDTIFVELGTNDSNGAVAIGNYDYTTAYTSLSEATFATAYIKGIKALQALYPNAQIVCVALNMDVGYRNAICKIAQYLGCKHVTSKDYEKGSGSHPNAHGMRQIASAVLSLQNSDSMFGTAVVSTRYIENGVLYLNNNNYTFGVAPSSNLSGAGITWTDLQNTTDAFIRHYARANGEYRLLAQVNGTDEDDNTVSHYTYLAVSGSGVPTVECSNPEAWRKGIGLTYKAGDTFTSSQALSLPGYITSSTKNIHLDVVVEKSLENISTISVTQLTGTIRGTTGYVDNVSTSSSWLTGYTVSATKGSGNIVHILISKSTALDNATNNTPICAALSVSLSFS